MPRKQRITKKAILDAAFDLVREEGVKHLSARHIAKRLGCSTQPVYSSFPSMGELELELMHVAWRYVFENYMTQEGEQQSFYAMGTGYIRFAIEERNIYHLIFISGKGPISLLQDQLDSIQEPVIKAMQSDPFLEDLPVESLISIHNQMWIFTHGITSMLYTDPTSISEEQIRQLLHEMGMKVIGWEMSLNEHNEENCPYKDH